MRHAEAQDGVEAEGTGPSVGRALAALLFVFVPVGQENKVTEQFEQRSTHLRGLLTVAPLKYVTLERIS